MGTRCGDIDPGVILYLLTHYSLSAEEVSDLLYKKSGLLGVSGETNNMRKLLASNDLACRQAVDLFCYQVNRHIGQLAAELGGLDQIIFTAGIGENSANIRAKICNLADWLGIQIDTQANENNETTISNQDSSVEISVIPTNEAMMIAKHTLNIVTSNA